ncbi:MAG: hypothetical protein AB2L07_22030 [Thermoanaerobaculaceae bacterium]
MAEPTHRDLAAGRWRELSLCELLGNVGSEVGLAFRWRSPDARVAAAFERALELLDLTLDDPRHRRSPARLREIARAREVFFDLLAGPNEYRSTPASLQRYFDAFAVAAFRQRSRASEVPRSS